ncbi:MAG TPA: GNAT family N-acetyltransferase [Anaerolineae bacterium]|nr:GNAT family N-acetyltransferase [Anaerolineae bacterium]
MIQLIPMTQVEFDKFLSVEIEEYAQEHVKAGNWHPDEAIQLSKAEHAKLLPNGLASPNQYLYSIQATDSGSNIGMIWFAEQQQGPNHYAFIYDFRIDEAQRGKGYGQDALSAIEEKVKALGLDTISLHVFGHNQMARSLYEKVGYEITNVNMSKKLTHDIA